MPWPAFIWAGGPTACVGGSPLAYHRPAGPGADGEWLTEPDNVAAETFPFPAALTWESLEPSQAKWARLGCWTPKLAELAAAYNGHLLAWFSTSRLQGTPLEDMTIGRPSIFDEWAPQDPTAMNAVWPHSWMFPAAQVTLWERDSAEPAASQGWWPSTGAQSPAQPDPDLYDAMPPPWPSSMALGFEFAQGHWLAGQQAEAWGGPVADASILALFLALALPFQGVRFAFELRGTLAALAADPELPKGQEAQNAYIEQLYGTNWRFKYSVAEMVRRFGWFAMWAPTAPEAPEGASEAEFESWTRNEQLSAVCWELAEPSTRAIARELWSRIDSQYEEWAASGTAESFPDYAEYMAQRFKAFQAGEPQPPTQEPPTDLELLVETEDLAGMARTALGLTIGLPLIFLGLRELIRQDDRRGS